MQNQLLAILHWALSILRLCRQMVWEVFLLPRGDTGPLEQLARGRLGALGFSADFDSARLDAVSRSVLWGAGALAPEPAPAQVRAPRLAARSAEAYGALRFRIHH